MNERRIMNMYGEKMSDTLVYGWSWSGFMLIGHKLLIDRCVLMPGVDKKNLLSETICGLFLKLAISVLFLLQLSYRFVMKFFIYLSLVLPFCMITYQAQRYFNIKV